MSDRTVRPDAGGSREDPCTAARSLAELQTALAARLSARGGGSEPFSLALLKLAPTTGDASGPELTDFLRGRTHGSEAVSWLGAGRFALLLDDVGEDLPERLEQAVRQFLAGGGEGGSPALGSDCRIWVGTARYPAEGHTVGGLVGHAQKRLAERGGAPEGKVPAEGGAPSKEGVKDPRRPTKPAAAEGAVGVAQFPPLPRNILVADDEPALRRQVAEILEAGDFEVETADSGEAALLAFGQRPFPVVVTDLEMGGIDGLELLRRVKQLNPDVQVILMTGRRSPKAVAAAFRAGAADCILKPFEDARDVAAAANRAWEAHCRVEEERRRLAEVRLQNEKLRRENLLCRGLTVRDPLTGLHNSRYFLEGLAREVHRAGRHGRTFSILLLDAGLQALEASAAPPIDETGALRAVASVLRDSLRRSDVVARYGAREFGLLLPETTREEALQLAEKVIRRLPGQTAAGEPEESERHVALHVGLATFPSDAEDAQGLVDKAVAALARARAGGGGEAAIG